MIVDLLPDELVVNLDPGFAPFGPGLELTAFTFPGGEEHVRLAPATLAELQGRRVIIAARLNSSEAVMRLLMLTDALRQAGSQVIRLFAPYMPYARQDRVAAPGDPFSAAVMGYHLINSAGFVEVIVFDPHSAFITEAIRNCRVMTNHDFVRAALAERDDGWLLAAPDAGALKKFWALSDALTYRDVQILCDKKRDPETGRLSGFEVHAVAKDIADRDVFIVDDICDGGGTFFGLAKAFHAIATSCRVHLIVSHGIFSKGFAELYGQLNSVTTTDSWGDWGRHPLTENGLLRCMRFTGRRAS